MSLECATVTFMHLNSGYSYLEHLDTKARGHTVLSYLEKHYTHSSKEAWLGRLQHGEILLDNRIARGNEILQTGQQLVWNRPPWYEEETPQTFEIIYQDDALLVVNKPSGLPTMPGGGFLDNTLFNFVRKKFPTAHPLHRLGRGTSGLVVFALTNEAASSLSKLWREQKVEKYYKALASGVAQQNFYEIRGAIGLVEHPKLGYVHAASDKGKPSSSDATVLERQTNSTLFEVKIFTGRPHQIRIHLAFIGHPLQGDPLYTAGGKLLDNPGLPGEGGYFLHAERLKFLQPVTGAWLEVEAPAPLELRCNGEII
jgi:23S rRNA pseudouridine1911/1915/1917 synthase